jgi:hypothetical protein
MKPSKTIIGPDELMPEVPLAIQEMAQPHLVAIYNDKPDQVGTAFLTIWHGKPLLVTAKHTLFGATFNENPLAKQIHLDGDLRTLGEIVDSEIADHHDLDVAIMHVRGFDLARCLPYTALQFNASYPGIISLVGFLARDFHRSKTESTLKPQPYCYTNLRVDVGPERIGMKYANRAITTDTQKHEMAPIPRGLSGTFMLSTSALLLGQIKVFGVFTDARLNEAHVYGTHVSALDELMKSLLNGYPRPRG